MNQVATIDRPARSVTLDMATRYGMEPQAFEATLRATVVPNQVSREQFAAFLLVAKEYDLNPLTKEIYAFPTRGGGIQPIVGVDGWANLINSHPACDGFEFVDNFDDQGEIVSITCRIFRKDRSHAGEATEYMAECKRATDPWNQWPRRMLRHKALIQAARYAFGFSGIIDPDEWERSPESDAAKTISPPSPPSPPPAEIEHQHIDHPDPDASPEASDKAAESEDVSPPPSSSDAPEDSAADLSIDDPEKFLADIEGQLATAADRDAITEIWACQVEPYIEADAVFPPDKDRLDAAYRKHLARVEG